MHRTGTYFQMKAISVVVLFRALEARLDFGDGKDKLALSELRELRLSV